MDNSHTLSDSLVVGPPPSQDDLKALADAGFKTIVNNRPDDEDGVEMRSDAMQAAVTSAGMAYEHVPVEGRNPMEGSVKAFAQSLADTSGPIYAYCKTGGRSAALWALASVMDFDNATLIQKCADGGHDIAMLEPKLNSRRMLLEDEDDDDD